jgi:hypothetical protein
MRRAIDVRHPIQTLRSELTGNVFHTSTIDCGESRVKVGSESHQMKLFRPAQAKLRLKRIA